MTTAEERPGTRPGLSTITSQNHTTPPGYHAHTDTDDPSADKWRRDWRRRVERAIVDEKYFEISPRGVQEAALQSLGRDVGDVA
jgi:hypothetical protein